MPAATSSVSGGPSNTASGPSAASAVALNTASGFQQRQRWPKNTASGQVSSVSGGSFGTETD
jgi:hypothetical protein